MKLYFKRLAIMSTLVYEATYIVSQYNFYNDGVYEEQNPPLKGAGLKYVGAYTPDIHAGMYNEIPIQIIRFNNENINPVDDDKYQFIKHKCHVWVDTILKQVYIVFRGTISYYDWHTTDMLISTGLGLQDNRISDSMSLLQKIYDDIFVTYSILPFEIVFQKQLRSKYGLSAPAAAPPPIAPPIAPIAAPIAAPVAAPIALPRQPSSGTRVGTDRSQYKIFLSGHSLGGFIAHMVAVMVFNNNIFHETNTNIIKNVVVVTFNPFFPSELNRPVAKIQEAMNSKSKFGFITSIISSAALLLLPGVPGVLNQGNATIYVPLLNYGITESCVFGIREDFACKKLATFCGESNYSLSITSVSTAKMVGIQSEISNNFVYHSFNSVDTKIDEISTSEKFGLKHGMFNFCGYNIYKNILCYITTYFRSPINNNPPCKMIEFINQFNNMVLNTSKKVESNNTILSWVYIKSEQAITDYNGGPIVSNCSDIMIIKLDDVEIIIGTELDFGGGSIIKIYKKTKKRNKKIYTFKHKRTNYKSKKKNKKNKSNKKNKNKSNNKNNL